MSFDYLRKRRLALLPTSLAIIIGILLPCAALAEEFRIETKIFAGEEEEEEEPIGETITLFQNGAVYDFLSEPAQIAMFRKPTGSKPGQFILLDPERRIRTGFSSDQLTGAMKKLHNWASRQNDPFLQFAANPKFEESFEPESGQLVLASHYESYTLQTVPADKPRALAEYCEFLDWYAKLNTLMQAGPPPEPRLAVNAALARHGVVPVQIERKRSGDKTGLRAVHAFTWRLSRQDRKRIDEVHDSLASYSQVGNEEFLKRTEATR